MTQAETKVLERLCNQVADLSKQFITLETAVSGFRQDFKTLVLDVYGVPGEKDTKPGLMGDVIELKSRDRLRLTVLRSTWTIATLLIGALAAALAKSIF